MGQTIELLSLQVGQPEPLPGMTAEDRATLSAIFKRPVDGALFLGTQGLEGDKQADRRNHGGPFRAVNVYPSEHYQTWRAMPGLEAMSGGAFGENFTTQGWLEETACIGDVYQVGEAIVSITQPRGPCYKLNRKWHVTDLQQRAEQSGRVGWYLRVVQTGRVQAGQAITLLERPAPEWTIARVWALHRDPGDQDSLRRLVEVPGLSDGWREQMQRKIGKHSRTGN